MIPTRPDQFRSASFVKRPNTEWQQICDYLTTVFVEGMRKSLCHGCGVSRLYDKNEKRYLITRNQTLDQVKAIVEEIRLINSQTNQE